MKRPLLRLALLLGASFGCGAEARAPSAEPSGRAALPTAPSSSVKSDASSDALSSSPPVPGELILAPTLARGTSSKGIPDRGVPLGHPQFLWRSVPEEHHCLFEAEAGRARCTPIGQELTSLGEVFAPVSMGSPKRVLLFTTVGPIENSKIRILDLAGNVVHTDQTGAAYLSPNGSLWGLERSDTLHHYENARASAHKATKLNADAAQVVGDHILSTVGGASRSVEVRAVLPNGDLGQAVKLGTVPDMLVPYPCLDASQRASVLYLPTFGDSPRVVHGYLQSDSGWSKGNSVATEEPFNATFTTCGSGWIAATDAHHDHVQYVRCTAKGCTYEKIVLSSSLAAATAAVLDDKLVLVDLITIGPDRGVRVRIGPPKQIETAPSYPIECADAERERWIKLVRGTKGAFVVLEDRSVGVLCAFEVSANGTIRPVEPTPIPKVH